MNAYMRHRSQWRNCSFAASVRMKTMLAPLSSTILISGVSLDQREACALQTTIPRYALTPVRLSVVAMNGKLSKRGQTDTLATTQKTKQLG